VVTGGTLTTISSTGGTVVVVTVEEFVTDTFENETTSFPLES
jgi:hypothetical protein